MISCHLTNSTTKSLSLFFCSDANDDRLATERVENVMVAVRSEGSVDGTMMTELEEEDRER